MQNKNLKFKANILIFCKEMFYVLTGALFVFSLMEFFWPRIVLAYININLVLILWLATGILILQMNKKNDGK